MEKRDLEGKRQAASDEEIRKEKESKRLDEIETKTERKGDGERESTKLCIREK